MGDTLGRPTMSTYSYIAEDYRIEQYTQEVSPESWKSKIKKEALSCGYTVYSPEFPSGINAHYTEWRLYMDRLVKLLPVNVEITLIGHSLGGNSLIKYLTERNLKARQLHLMAACYNEGSFTEPADWEAIAGRTENIHIWHALDDEVVPYADALYIREKIPTAELHTIESGGHLRIPEIEGLKGVIFR